MVRTRRHEQRAVQNAPIGALLGIVVADLYPSQVGFAVKFSFAGPF